MKYFPRLNSFLITVEFMLFITGGILARSAPDGTPLVYWRFEGNPGDHFLEGKSELGECSVTGQIGAKTSTDLHPVYGLPAPDVGGGSSLLLSNKLVADNDGVFAVSEVLPEMKGITGITVEAWVNPATIRESAILRSAGASGDDLLQFDLREDGSVCFRIIHMGTEYAVVSSPGSLPENEWHHLAGVFGPDGLSLYIDGRFAAGRQKERVPWPEISGSFGRLGIGAYIRNQNLTSVGLFFDGQIDEVRITGRELEPAEFLSGGRY